MSEIYVTGHQNPDMDCTTASYCYSYLKSRIDPDNTYIPIRCGSLNSQTKQAFQRAGISPPELFKSIRPVVEDITKPVTHGLKELDTILDAIRILLEHNISLLPVFSPDNAYAGVVSINEISRFILSQQTGKRPSYEFHTDSIAKVIPGHIIKQGKPDHFTAPILSGAMPHKASVSRLSQLAELPLLVVGNRKSILKFAVDNQFPAIIITGMESEETPAINFDDYQGTVFRSDTDTAETIRLLRLSSPVKTIMLTNVPRLDAGTDFDEAKRLLNRSDYRGLPVFEDGSFIGTVTRRCFLERPRKKLIMIDHNEISQSVKGGDEADIIEIIDHHRFATGKTRNPIYISAKPVGSTSTIVYQHYKHEDVPIPQNIALLLLSGIISDTVNLKSPTTTDDDRKALTYLCGATEVDPETYTKELFAQLTMLKSRKAEEIIHADFKRYEHEKTTVGIGQVEVTTLEDIPEMSNKFRQALQKTAYDEGLAWTMLMITDVMKQDSLLITNGNPALEEHLLYEAEGDCRYSMPGILSRKKQLLPEVMRVISLENQ